MPDEVKPPEQPKPPEKPRQPTDEELRANFKAQLDMAIARAVELREKEDGFFMGTVTTKNALEDPRFPPGQYGTTVHLNMRMPGDPRAIILSCLRGIFGVVQQIGLRWDLMSVQAIAEMMGVDLSKLGRRIILPGDHPDGPGAPRGFRG